MPGQVVTYCPMTARFVLLYSDGSSDGVPANEIEDHVPLLRQLPSAEKRNWKKRRAENCREERQEPTKRCKSKHDSKTAPVAAKTPSASDVSTLATRFVQDTLWALTTVLDVDDETIKTLLVALDNRNEQVSWTEVTLKHFCLMVAYLWCSLVQHLRGMPKKAVLKP